MPRHLHFEVHTALCLPRNLHSRVNKCCACHEVCTSRFTQCRACHEICTSRFTKCCACHEVCTSRFTNCCACHESCTSRFTKCCAYEICTSCCSCHEVASEPHVQKSRFTAPVTKSERLEDHHHVQSAAPATKSALRCNTAPIPCACHENEKLTLDHQNTRFPLHLPRHAPATQILRACAVEIHVDDFKRHECTINSSELAAHARSKHTCFSTTVRTPKCVHTVWGTFNVYGCFKLQREKLPKSTKMVKKACQGQSSPVSVEPGSLNCSS